MNTDRKKLEFEEITKAIIGSAFEVYNILGYGFLEKVYQRAMQVELLRRGHNAGLEHPKKLNIKVPMWVIMRLIY